MCSSTNVSSTPPSEDADGMISLSTANTEDRNQRPGTISISGNMCRKLRRLLTAWILFSQDAETGKIHVIPQEFSTDVLMASIGEEEPILLAVGLLLQELELGEAELVSINGMLCRGVPLLKVQDVLIMLEGDFTITFVKSNADEWIKRVVVIKPLLPSSDVLSQEDDTASFWAGLTCKMEPVEKEPIKESKEENAEQAAPVVITGAKELCLGPIPSISPTCQQQSLLAEGDRILAVNEKTNITELDPEDAQLTISFLFQCSPAHFSLFVWTPPSKRAQFKGGPAWRKNLRKGAIAMTGGVMVGAGAVLMVTPLHPIGHAMAFGGVGVLGTEFEQPRQAAKRASAGFSNMASSFRRSLHERRERRASARNNKDMPQTSSFGEDDTCTTVSTLNDDSPLAIPDKVEAAC